MEWNINSLKYYMMQEYIRVIGMYTHTCGHIAHGHPSGRGWAPDEHWLPQTGLHTLLSLYGTASCKIGRGNLGPLLTYRQADSMPDT